MATTKRHPSRTRHRTAVSTDGRLLAMDIDFVIDGGAYCTLSPVVLSRGTIHAAGPYFCPNVRVRGRAVATNAPPHGAFRGFGAPQSIFALERHMDRVAAAVGLAPGRVPAAQLHHDRARRPPSGRSMREPVDMPRLLDRAFELSDYHAKRARFARENAAAQFDAGHRLRRVHARRRLHRLRRGSPRIGRQRRGGGRRPRPRAGGQHRDRSGNEHDLRADRRATRSASTATTSRSRSPTRRRCPTAGRPSRRARAWWSASSWRARRSA